MTTTKIKLLVLAEGATLAHVARPYVLAQSLAHNGHEIVFACPAELKWVTEGAAFPVVPLLCQSPAKFARRLERGQPLYDLHTLDQYVKDDLDLIRQHTPDLVLGDFRLSLSVSARLAGVPYATLCDAYWSPETPFEPILPTLPFTRFVPIALAQNIFNALTPLVFRKHAAPMDALRQSYGMEGFGGDLRLCYTDADLRLFANPAAIFPETRVHSGAAFIGPIAWSPEQPLPVDYPDDPDTVYVSMGSSGRLDVLDSLFRAVARLGLTAAVATAGRAAPLPPCGAKIKIFDFLPARAAISHARFVICNGGSPSTNLAYEAGKPVLAIPANMDQLMNMRAVVRAGLGHAVRADRVSNGTLEKALLEIMEAPPRTRPEDIAPAGRPRQEQLCEQATHLLTPLLAPLHTKQFRDPPARNPNKASSAS